MKIVLTVLSAGFLAVCINAGAQEPANPAPEAPRPTAPADPAPAASEPAIQSSPSASVEPVPAPPVQAAGVAADYKLGAEDAIHVDVWKQPSVSGPLLIRPDGKISIPLIGDLTAEGLTPMALAASIAAHLKNFINDPSVTVTVTAVNSKRVFFIGEVNRAGPLSLTRQMTVLQAISAAGGLTTFANRKKIYILRGEPGAQKKLRFDYNKALKTGDEQGVSLMPGDTIVVP
jgi:polysaccharide export outer membrane protein